jgi:hypothetical protein
VSCTTALNSAAFTKKAVKMAIQNILRTTTMELLSHIYRSIYAGVGYGMKYEIRRGVDKYRSVAVSSFPDLPPIVFFCWPHLGDPSLKTHDTVDLHP